MSRATAVTVLGFLLTVGVRAGLDDPHVDAFLDYVHAQPSFARHASWAVLFGTGWTEDSLEQIERWKREGNWINPFTGEPFDDDVQLFVFGQESKALELARILGDHLEIHALSSWKDLEGWQFDFAVCHSNGCTNAIDAHRSGVTRFDTLFALGTDWTSKVFGPADPKGAKLYFFAIDGDPIPHIPAPEWGRVETAPALQFSVPFDVLDEIPAGVVGLVRGRRPLGDSFPRIELEVPDGQGHSPGARHALVDSYFEAIRRWMGSRGEFQEEIRQRLQGPDRRSREEPQSGEDARGGVRIEILLDEADFAPSPGTTREKQP